MDKEIYTHINANPELPSKGGSLSGKRVVIQPNMSVRGWLTNAGSAALDGYVALDDATVIDRLKNTGVKLIGSSRMSELGFGLLGETGVQILSKGEADIALITDTMGEARVAASLSGCYGFKPSFGIVSRFGLIGLVPSMECFGIVAKNPADIVAVLEAISGKDNNDFSMPDETSPDFSSAYANPDRSCSVVFLRECIDVLTETEVKAFKARLEKLEGAGFEVKEKSLENFALLGPVHNVIASVEASSSAGKYDGVRYGHRCSSAKNWNEMYLLSRAESFGTLIKSFLFQGAYFQFENYTAFENACRIRSRLVRDIVKLFDGVDAIALPTRRIKHDASKAHTIRETYDAFSMTLLANLTGQPALHIPSTETDTEADVGLQFVGIRLNDALLLSVAVNPDLQ